jgi:hypothetical protein
MARSVGRWNAATPGRPQAMTAVMERRGVSTDRLFVHYLSIGGSCDHLEIDAWLHDVATLPTFEQQRLAHALWEIVEF